MSKPYDDNMKGVLFVNNRKDSPQAPDYRGHCEINRAKYRISGWKKQAKNGENYISFAFRTMDDDEGRDFM